MICGQRKSMFLLVPQIFLLSVGCAKMSAKSSASVAPQSDSANAPSRDSIKIRGHEFLQKFGLPKPSRIPKGRPIIPQTPVPIDTADNVATIGIGGPQNFANLAVISVTLCPTGVTGSQQCVTVPNVRLDTGSVGLRIFAQATATDVNGKSVLVKSWSPQLLPVFVSGGSSNKQNLVECYSYGGGDHYWGSIGTGDLVLGNIRATAVSVQVVDGSIGTPSGNCSSPTNPSSFEIQQMGYNGILGINPLPRDCGDVNCAGGSGFDPQYFSCAGTQCSKLSVVASALQVTNPISKMPTGYNNGYVLTFPNVGADGQSKVTGTLTLGVGTGSNNTPVSTSSLQFFQEDHEGWLRLSYAGKTYFSMIDTGTTLYYLPTQVPGIPMCAASGFWQYWLCASPAQTINAELMSGDSSNSEQVSLSIANARSLYGSGVHCLNNVGLLDSEVAQNGGSLSDTFIMGMPFLYGKTIYAGLGEQNALSREGPFDAIEMTP